MPALQGVGRKLMRFMVVAVVMLLSGSVWGDIVIDGSVDPVYGGMADPWVITGQEEMVIGMEADGSLTINNGSDVEVSDTPVFIGDYAAGFGNTTGTVLLTGPGSTWTITGDDFIVGPLAHGYLNVESGAQLTTGDGLIGGSPVFNELDEVTGVVAGDGTVVVSGGSQWDLGDWGWLTVAGAGTGDLTISTGGVVTGDTSEIGLAPGSVGTVIVDDADSTLTLTNDLVVGVWGQGTLTISDGGQVQSGRGWIGGADAALMGYDTEPIFDTFGAQTGDGAVVVTGATSRWDVDENLVVGAWGTGDLTIEQGAQVTVGSTAFIGGMPPAPVEGVEPSLDRFGTGTGHVLVTTDGSLTVEGDETLFVGYGGPGTLDVTAGGDVTTQAMIIGAGPETDGTVTVSGAGSTLTSTYEILVGAWGEGELTVSDGGSVSTEEVLIGGMDASDVDDLPQEVLDEFGPAVGPGTVTVTGASTLDAAERIYVGTYGEGTLNVNLGGTVTAGEIAVGVASGSHGIVNVSGTNSTLKADETYGVEEPGYYPGVMIVGGYGQGDVTVSSGGELIVNDVLYVGGYPAEELDFEPEVPGDPDGTGTVTITGADATLTGDVLEIGYSSQGTLEIVNGATATSESAIIGVLAEGVGEVLVDNTANTWTNTESIIVGAYGEGTLTVQNGGHVDVTDVVYIGGYETEEFENETFGYAFNPNGTGTVTVTGGDSLLNAGGIAVAVEGEGRLEILAGAEVTAQGAVVGLGANGVGEVLVDGPESTWRIDSEDVENEVPAALGEGTVNISNGGQVIVDGTGILNVGGEGQGTIRVGSDGEGTMTVSGGGSVTVDALDIGGTDPMFDTLEEYFAPGVEFTEGAGAVTVTGAGSNVDVDSVVVGFAGSGALNIDNGASVTSHTAFLGAVPETTGTVEVSNGSTWNAGENIVVGVWGQGDLTISGGSDVTTGEMYIGGTSFDLLDEEGGEHDPELMPNGTGTVTVNASTLTVAEEFTLHVGYNGTGTLNLENGSSLDSDVVVVGGSPDAVGHVNVNDSEMSNIATVVGAWGQGDITMTNDSYLWTGTMYIGGFDATEAGPFADLVEELGNPDGVGTVTVENSSALDVGGFDTLVVGAGGTGTLNVLTDGDVTSVETFVGGYLTFEDTEGGETGQIHAGTGTVAVDGDGSTLDSDVLVVGTGGSGTLDVTDGGAVSSHLSIIGFGPDASGRATVSGAGEGGPSTWLNTPTDIEAEDPYNGTLIVGGWGDGDLEVSDGGRVQAITMYIGGFDVDELGGGETPTDWDLDDPAGTGIVTVTGPDAILDVSGLATLHVGYSGEGTLDVLAGGEVQSQSSIIGTQAGSSGSATVSGGESLWSNSSTLLVGDAGQGDLLVEEGGRVTALSALIGNAPGSSGRVEVTGQYSSMEIENDLFVGAYGSGPAGIGTLMVNDGGNVQVGGDLFISTTGTVGGDGTISVLEAETVHNYGTIAPGNEGIGTLDIYGNVVFHEGSTYAVEIANDNTSDKLQVGGDVDIQGGTVQVDSQGTIVGEHDYEIINAYGVTGEFDVLDTALVHGAITDANLGYEETSVWLHITADDFADPNVARTYNQRQVAGALQQIAGEDADNPITDNLQDLPEAGDVRHSYDQLSGQSRPPLGSLTAAGTSKFLGTVASRMQTVQTGLVNSFTSPGLLAMAGPDTTVDGARTTDANPQGQTFSAGKGTAIEGNMPWGVWGRAYGLYGDRETEFEAPGYNYDMLGFSMGLDYQFTDVWLAGLVVGTADGDVDFARSRDTTDFEAKYVGLYGSAAWDKWYWDTVATLARLEYDTERFVDLLGERLTGSFDGYEMAAYTEVGRKWQLAPDLLLQPLGSLQYSYLSLDDYMERGGASALAFDKQTHESLKGSLGARLTKSLIETMGDFRASVQVRGRWVHEFADDRASVDTSFATNPAAVFNVRDAKIDRDSAVLGVGLFGDLTKHTRVYLDYDTRFNSDESTHVVGASLQYRW